MHATTVAPVKLVQVIVDGAWHDGTLEAVHRTGGRWRGYAPWSHSVALLGVNALTLSPDPA